MPDRTPPLLTISITTRNRADFIGRTLDSIVSQLTEEVELLINDGASTDDTPAVIEAYRRRYPNIRYVRQESNNGPDRDFDISVELARGEYCWLMTDDDILQHEAVSAVLRALAPRPSLVIVNAEVRNADLSEVLEAHRLPLTVTRVFRPGESDRLFEATAPYLSFIGGVVIRRSTWLERNRREYYGSLFIHVGVIFQSPLPGDAVVVPEPLIAIRYGNAKWQSRQFEIWMLKWPSLVWSFEHLAPDSRRAVSVMRPWRDPMRLLLYRAKGAYGVGEYRRFIRPRTTASWERLLALCIARIPGILANAIALLACSLQRADAGYGKAGPGQRILDLRDSPYHFRNWSRRAHRSS